MSGRGTIKAGTFGGRRYREKVVKKTKEAKDLETLIRQAQAKEKAPFKRVPPSQLGAVRHQTSDMRKHERLRKDMSGTMMGQQGGWRELGVKGADKMRQSSKDRDVQIAVNTIPYMYDAGALRAIRAEVEQDQRQTLNPDVDFEQAEDDDLAEMFGIGQADVAEDFNVAEAGREIAPAEADEFEGGEVEYGAEGWDMADATDALDLGAFLDAPEQEDELGEPLFGMDELTGMVGGDTDTDEEAEEFGRQLDEVDPNFIQNRLKEEIEKRRQARGVGSLSAPAGDRIRPAWKKEKRRDEHGKMRFPGDVSGSGVAGYKRPEKEDEPEPLDFTGTGEQYDDHLIRSGDHATPHHLINRKVWDGHRAEHSTAGIGFVAEAREQQNALLEEHYSKEVEEEDFVSRGADPKFSGWASENPDKTGFIGGLKQVEKHKQKHSLAFYKRKKMTKKEIKDADAQGIKHDGTKLDIGAKGMKPTDELLRLEEGRIMDLRMGHTGKSVAVNAPEIGFQGGERSKKNEKLIREETGYQHGKKKEWELGEGVKRDPRTRKILMDSKGEPKMENKKLTITGRRKAVEQAWGLSQKGMDRDAPHYRDPWSGSRAIGKEPGKRATKVKEAETKHKLYVKTQREKDPNYVPRGYNPFQYGAGETEWDDKKASRKRETFIGGQGGIAHSPSPIGGGAVGSGTDTYEAGQRAMALVASQTPSNIKMMTPYQQAIAGKRRPPGQTINLSNITNPPMSNLQSQFKLPHSFGGGDTMTQTSASEVANMSWDEIHAQYGGDGGGANYRPDDEGDMTYSY